MRGLSSCTVKDYLQSQLLRGRHRQTGSGWYAYISPGTCISGSQIKPATALSWLDYVRGAPVPDAHFRRDLADTGPNSQASGAVGRTPPAMPCHTDPRGSPCTSAGGLLAVIGVPLYIDDLCILIYPIFPIEPFLRRSSTHSLNSRNSVRQLTHTQQKR